MRSLRVAVPALTVVAWLVGAGCEDDRGAVDIGVGGDAFVAGGQAAGGAAAGGQVAGGAAGAGGVGEGGSAGAPECPADFVEAEGTDCSAFGEGAFCSDGASDPCDFGQAIVCVDDEWQRQEAFPAPCGGAGGAAGNAGAGGESGGAGGVGGAQ